MPTAKGQLTAGKNRRKNTTDLVGWNKTAFISARDVDQEFIAKSPNYFQGLENEDPDLYLAILESLRISTSDPDYLPQGNEVFITFTNVVKSGNFKQSQLLRYTIIFAVTRTKIVANEQTSKMNPINPGPRMHIPPRS